MMTDNLSYKTLRLNDNPSDINKACLILKKGGLVALPTETVYGLAANGFNKEAIKKIYQAKNRLAHNPLILHSDCPDKCLDLLELNDISKKRFHNLANQFWPGPLTIVGNKKPHILTEITANLDTLALRIPAHPTTLKVLKSLDFPLAMPSANLSLRPSPTTSSHVLKTLDGLIDAVLDGGPCSIGIESTIINIASEMPSILRLGMISIEDIEQCLHESITIAHHDEQKPLSPGAMSIHYRPSVNAVYLIDKTMLENIWHSDAMLLISNKDFNHILSIKGKRPKLALTQVLSDHAADYAKNLYNALYHFESYPDCILYIVNPSDQPSFKPILDRLVRACDQP